MTTRTDIINNIITNFKLEHYLEIGVRNPKDNFNKINIEYKVGVDPNPISPVEYLMTSDEFFSNLSENTFYDIIFIDGLHTKEQVYLDVINSIKHLKPYGFIILHDCNPEIEYYTRSYEEYLSHRGHWNGDVFKAFIRLKQELSSWCCFVINEDFGCGILTENKLKKFTNTNISNVYDLTWEEFNNNRKILLNLIEYADFISIIKKN